MINGLAEVENDTISLENIYNIGIHFKRRKLLIIQLLIDNRKEVVNSGAFIDTLKY